MNTNKKTYKAGGTITLNRNRGYVYVCYNYQRKKLKRTTDVKALDSEWDNDKRCLKPDANNYFERSAKIIRTRNAMAKAVKDLLNIGLEPDLKKVRVCFDLNMNIHADSKGMDDFWKNISDFTRNEKRGASKAYKNKIKNWSKSLLQFESSGFGIKWSKTSISKYQHDKYMTFLGSELNLADNTVRGYNKLLKCFLRKYYPEHYWARYIKTLDIQPKPVALTEEELMRLLFLNVDDKWKEVHTVFCMLCLTGMEFKDLKNYKQWESVDRYFSYSRNRTGILARVPAGDILKSFINKLLLCGINHTPSYYCRLIKILFQEYDFSRNVTYFEYRNRKAHKITKSLSEMVCMSTGHRTFTQILFDKGFSLEEVKSMTGIVSDECLNPYRLPASA